MPTPSSGALNYYTSIGQTTLGSTFSAFWTSNIDMASMRGGAGKFPYLSVAGNSILPSTGAISAANMYNVYGYRSLSFTMTVGNIGYSSGKTTIYKYGFALNGVVVDGKSSTTYDDVSHDYYNDLANSFGSISANSFTTYHGTLVIVGLYQRTDAGQWWFDVARTAGAPGDSDLYYASVNVTGYMNAARSARATFTNVTKTSSWRFGNTSYPTSGSVSCSVTYYG